MELEDVLNHITGPMRMKLADVMRDMGLERGAFQSWRRSSDPRKRQELAKKIVALYPGEFPEGDVPGAKNSEEEEKSLMKRMIQLLEKLLEKAEAENRELREEIETLNRQLLK